MMNVLQLLETPATRSPLDRLNTNDFSIIHSY